jgi:hypothetical protein
LLVRRRAWFRSWVETKTLSGRLEAQTQRSWPFPAHVGEISTEFGISARRFLLTPTKNHLRATSKLLLVVLWKNVFVIFLGNGK